MHFGCDDVSKRIWGEWLDALPEINEQYIAEGERPLASTGYGGNAMGGMLGAFPIVSCLIAQPDSRIEQQYTSICMLLLQKILVLDSSYGLNSVARLLRCISNTERTTFFILQRLPVYMGDLSNFKLSLTSELENLRKEYTDDKYKKYFDAIEKLAQFDTGEKTKVRTRTKGNWRVYPELIENFDDEANQVGVSPVIDIDEITGEFDKWYFVQEKEKEQEGALLRPKVAAEASAKLTRYWLRRYHKLTSEDRACLTPLERRRLAKFIVDDLKSESNETFVAALWVAIAYLTPLSFIDARNVLAEKDSFQRVTLNGEYVLKIQQLANGYKYTQESLKECYEAESSLKIELHIMLVQALSRLKQLKGGSILEKLNVDYEEIDEILDKKLDILRANGQYRLTKQRIGYAFKAAIICLEHNPIITYYLSCNEKHAPPMLLYYGALLADQICEVYDAASSHLMMDELCEPIHAGNWGEIYTKTIAKRSTVSTYVGALNSHVSQVVSDNKSKLWEKHNEYTDYIVALLMYATGHRPVQDPFDSLEKIDLQAGLILINDKSMDEMRAYRLVSLPDIAVKQIELYCDYLEQLSITLVRMGKAHFDLSCAIRTVLNTNDDSVNQIIPLFFYLDKDLTSTSSVTQETVAAFLNLVTWVPNNYNRHVSATELLKNRLCAQQAEIQLGHIEGVDHPFGLISELVPVTELHEVGNSIDEIMGSHGWEVMPSILKKKRINIQNQKQLRIKRVNVHKGTIFGDELRKINREIVNGRYASLVRDILNQFEDITDIDRITTDDVENIVTAISAEAKEKHLSVNRCNKLFYTWLSRSVSSNSKLFYLRKAMVVAESSPFGKETLSLYRKAVIGREKFVTYLELAAKNGEGTSIELRLAEIIMSAVLFGCVGSSVRLKDLCSAVLSRCYHYKDSVFLDLVLVEGDVSQADKNVFRWFPDDISMALIAGLYEIKGVDGYKVDGGKLNQKLIYLMRELSIGFKKKDIWGQLARLSENALLVEAPGYVRAVASEKISSASVPLDSYIRILSGEKLKRISKKPERHEFKKHILNINVSACSSKGFSKNSHLFLNKMRSAFYDALNIEVKANKKFNKRAKDALIDNIKEVIGKGDKWSEVANVLACWAIFLCKFGTRRKENIKFNTVNKYFFMVSNALMDLVNNGSILTMSAEDFEKLYIKAVGYDTRNNPAEFVGRLQEFHIFLTEHWPVSMPEWGVIYAYAGGSTELSVPDANYIREDEYLECFSYLRNCSELERLERWQYSVMLLLGYRFGLRFDEVYRTQWRDIQHDLDFNELSVLVNNNAYGDTKSTAGVRVVPLTVRLTEVEVGVLKALKNEFKSSFEYDAQQGLMAEFGDKRKLIDDAAASIFINEVIRSITGDDLLHFHHLRHSFANNIWLGDFHCNDELNSASINGLTLRAAAVVIGHTSEETLLGSYVHKLDKVISTYSKKITPRLSLKLFVYAANINYEAAKKRLSRNKSMNKSTADLLQLEKLLPQPDVCLVKRDDKDISVSKSIEITLNVIDLVIQAASGIITDANQAAQINIIAERFMLNSNAVEKIFLAATYVEGESGYNRFDIDRYNDSLLSNNLLQNKAFQPGNEEASRMKGLLKDRQIIMDKLNDHEKSIVSEGINVWIKGYDQASNDIIVAEINDIKKYQACLDVLGIEHLNYSVAVPDEFEGECENIKNQLGDLFEVMTSPLRFAHEKTVRRRKSRLKVAVQTKGTSLKTKTTFAMMMFFIAVSLQVQI